MSKKEKLQPWQQPLHFDGNGMGTITKAQYERAVEKIGRPLSWMSRSDANSFSPRDASGGRTSAGSYNGQ